MKRSGKIPLTDKISKQSSIDFVMWLLVITITELYNVKEKSKQGKYKNVQIEEKGGIRKENEGS